MSTAAFLPEEPCCRCHTGQRCDQPGQPDQGPRWHEVSAVLVMRRKLNSSLHSVEHCDDVHGDVTRQRRYRTAGEKVTGRDDRIAQQWLPQ
jgi:hypothetical protein